MKDEDFLNVSSCMELGVLQGWWPSFDPIKFEPHPWPFIFDTKEGTLFKENRTPQITTH